MKKAIIVAAFMVLGIVANAQGSSKEIGITDQTTQYLLQRIEELEHKVAFLEDKTDLEFLQSSLENVCNQAMLDVYSKKQVREYWTQAKKGYEAIMKGVSVNSQKYRYTEHELDLLDSRAKLIEYDLSILEKVL